MNGRMARATRKQPQANLDLTRFKIESSLIRAPHSSTLMVGGLRERLGDAIAKGSVLFEVAPHTDWTLSLEVPEARIASVRPGQTGIFASRSRPDRSNPFELKRISPSAEMAGEKNVFIEEVGVKGQQPGTIE